MRARARYHGILRLGAVVEPMNVLLKGRETAFYLSDPGVMALKDGKGIINTATQGTKGSPTLATRKS